MTVAIQAQRGRVRSIAMSPCSAPAKETVSDKLARYRSAAKAAPHDQRGTDAEVNRDAAKQYKGWQDLRKQATSKK
jgi:hypothetical protein